MVSTQLKNIFIGYVSGPEEIVVVENGIAITTHTENCLNRPEDQRDQTDTVMLTCNSKITMGESGLLTIREFNTPIAVFGLISGLEGPKHYDALVPLVRMIESAIPPKTLRQ